MKTDRIRSLAKERDITLSAICRKLNVKPVYFIDIDKSGRNIPPDKLQVIADTLNTTPEYLKGETEEKEKPISDERHAKEELLLSKIQQLTPEQRRKFDIVFEAVLAGKVDITNVAAFVEALQADSQPE